jgi:hypothetical protein
MKLVTWLDRMRLRGSQTDWANELDFTGPRIRPARWAWLLLLAGCAAVMSVMPMVNEVEAALQAEQDTLKRLQRATQQHAMRQSTALRQGEGRGDTTLKPEAMAQAARLARSLSYPWLPLLNRVEAAAQARQAVLLSFGLDLSSMDARSIAMPDARISAAVVDDEQALAWVQAHGVGAQWLGRERLATALNTEAGIYAWRADALLEGGAP